MADGISGMDLLKVAGASFGAAGAAVAIPAAIFLVWMPREFDDIGTGVRENAELIQDVSLKSDTLINQVGEIAAQINGVNEEADLSTTSLGYLAALMDGDKRVVSQIIRASLGQSELNSWRASGELSYVLGSTVNGEDFLYVNSVDVPRISPDRMRTLERLAADKQVRLRIWNKAQFPGADFVFPRKVVTGFATVPSGGGVAPGMGDMGNPEFPIIPFEELLEPSDK